MPTSSPIGIDFLQFLRQLIGEWVDAHHLLDAFDWSDALHFFQVLHLLLADNLLALGGKLRENIERNIK